MASDFLRDVYNICKKSGFKIVGFITDIPNIFKLDNYGLSDDTAYLVKMEAF